MYLDNEKKIKESHRIYLFYGTEGYLLREYANRVLEDYLPREDWDVNLQIIEEMPTYARLAEAVNSVPFFGGRHAVLVRDAGWLQTGRGNSTDEERIAELVADVPEDCRLILVVSGKIDGRKKITKVVKKYSAVIECAPLKSKEIVGWIQRRTKEMGIRLSADGMQYLLSVLSLMQDISLDFIEQELNKATIYTGKTVINRSALSESMAAVPEASVFLLLEALSDKQAAKAMKLLREQDANGIPLMKTIVLLARQVRMLWQAAVIDGRGGRADDVKAETGVQSFVAEKLIRQSRNFSLASLRQAITALADAEQEFKSGRGDGAIIEQIVLTLCASKRR